MRRQCLLFEPWYSGIVSQTKVPSNGNIGNQVTRRGGVTDCLFGVSDVSVCYLKGAPAHQLHSPFTAVRALCPARSQHYPAIGLGLSYSWTQQLAWHKRSLSHSPAVPSAWETLASLAPPWTHITLPTATTSFWQKARGRSLVQTILWFLLLTLRSLQAFQILQTKAAVA